MQPSFLKRASDVLSRVQFEGFEYITATKGEVVFLQIACSSKCNVTGEPMRWTSRKWMLSEHMTDGEIAFAVQKLKDSQAVTGGDAAQLGIGAMTEARWKKNFDFMVESGLLSPSTEWRKAYTTRFIDDLKVMP